MPSNLHSLPSHLLNLADHTHNITSCYSLPSQGQRRSHPVQLTGENRGSRHRTGMSYRLTECMLSLVRSNVPFARLQYMPCCLQAADILLLLLERAYEQKLRKIQSHRCMPRCMSICRMLVSRAHIACQRYRPSCPNSSHLAFDY